MKIKKILPIFVAVLVFVLNSCALDVEFPITQDIEEQTVKGLLGDVKGDGCNIMGAEKLYNVFAEPISIDIKNSQEYKQKAPKQITSVELDKVVLKITDTKKAGENDIDNFDFLNSIQIVAEYPNDASKSVVIGELNPVPQGQTEITIKGNGANIIDFLNGENFKITTKTDAHLPCDNESFNGKITLIVKGTLQ